jgi:hypothetical protein
MFVLNSVVCSFYFLLIFCLSIDICDVAVELSCRNQSGGISVLVRRVIFIVRRSCM